MEHQRLNIPLEVIRQIRTSHRQSWTHKARASVELTDGSVYKSAVLDDEIINLLTLLGQQTVKLTEPKVVLRGHTVGELDELRERLESTLQRHHGALVEKVGRAVFETYFQHAA